MSPSPLIKFRPSLTLPEIQTILQFLPPAAIHNPLRRKLEVFTLKAQHGITNPSHVAIGQQSIESRLGLTEDARIDTLLAVYQTNPSILSRDQLTRVQFHRFQNDMMTPEEELAYLNSGAV